MHKLIEYIDDTMQEYEDKVARGGDLSSKDVECLKDLAKTKMAILTNEAMEEDSRYSHDSSRTHHYDGGISYARGRGRNARRDAMGRYSSDYSYDNAKDDMMRELREIVQKAPDETTKRKVEKFIEEMQSV